MSVNRTAAERGLFPGSIAGPSIMAGGDLGMVAGVAVYNMSFGAPSDPLQFLPLVAAIVVGCLVGAVVGGTLGWVADTVVTWRKARPLGRRQPA